MFRIRGYKFRAYPDRKQRELLERTFGCCRFVYNHFLSLRKQTWEEEQKDLTYKEMSRGLTALKKEKAWLKEPDSISLQQALRHLEQAYQGFFSGRRGYPRFKRKSSSQSYRTMNVNGNIRICGNSIKLPKAGSVKIVYTREIRGRILSAAVTRCASGKYYISLQVEEEYVILPNRGGKTGIDLGLKYMYTASDGTKAANPRTLKKHEKRLRRLQKGLSRKKKGSHNREKARRKLAAEHEKVASIRNDWQHKITHHLASENQVVCMEDLNVQGMMGDHRVARGISDVSWYEFGRKMEYKIKDHGGILVKIPRTYPSSQRCSCCGRKNPEVKDLKIRKWTCPGCRTEHDRDINAAVNIRNKGLEMLAS